MPNSPTTTQSSAATSTNSSAATATTSTAATSTQSSAATSTTSTVTKTGNSSGQIEETVSRITGTFFEETGRIEIDSPSTTKRKLEEEPKSPVAKVK